MDKEANTGRRLRLKQAPRAYSAFMKPPVISSTTGGRRARIAYGEGRKRLLNVAGHCGNGQGGGEISREDHGERDEQRCQVYGGIAPRFHLEPFMSRNAIGAAHSTERALARNTVPMSVTAAITGRSPALSKLSSGSVPELQSTLMPAAVTTRFHLARSVLISAANWSGPPAFTSPPCRRSASCTSGCLSAAAVSR